MWEWVHRILARKASIIEWAFNGLGAGLLIFALTTYIGPSEAVQDKAEANTITESPGAQVARDGSVINNGNGPVRVDNSIHYGVSEEKFQELSEKYGVTKNAVKSFFRILGRQDIPQEDWHSELHELAKRHLTMVQKLQQTRGGDAQIQTLREKASRAIKDGQYDKAEDLLTEIRRRAENVAERKENELQQYRLMSAESSASLGMLKMNQYDFLGAAEEYANAAETVSFFDPRLQAQYLNNRGEALWRAGAFEKATDCYRTCLSLCEKEFGADSKEAARSCNNLAVQLEARGAFPEAEKLYRRALKIQETVYGPDHHEVAATCNNLAALLQTQGEYTEAEKLYRRALKIQETVYGPNHHEVAGTCNNLAGLLKAKGEFTEAEKLYRRALKIEETVYGPDHHELGVTLFNFSLFHARQGNLTDARPLAVRARAIFKDRLGPEHRYTQQAEATLEQINKDLEKQSE